MLLLYVVISIISWKYWSKESASNWLHGDENYDADNAMPSVLDASVPLQRRTNDEDSGVHGNNIELLLEDKSESLPASQPQPHSASLLGAKQPVGKLLFPL